MKQSVTIEPTSQDSMLNKGPEFAGILHDITLNPANDQLRLIAADWLDEVGDLVWADMIREQIRFGIDGSHSAPCDCGICKRYRLWQSQLNEFGNKWMWEVVALAKDFSHNMWFDVPDIFNDHSVSWERGFPRKITVDAVFVEPNFLAALFSRFPITAISVPDTYPILKEYGGGDDRWCWYRAHTNKLIWPFLDQLSPAQGYTCIECGTPANAREFFSHALVNCGRSYAGLPQLFVRPVK